MAPDDDAKSAASAKDAPAPATADAAKSDAPKPAAKPDAAPAAKAEPKPAAKPAAKPDATPAAAAPKAAPKPEAAKPAEAKPADVKPAEAKPAPKPEAAKAPEAKKADPPKPAEKKPEPAKPAPEKPAAAKPAAAKPEPKKAEPAKKPEPAKKEEPAKKAEPAKPKVAPIAQPAKMRRRHWGLIFSFITFVIFPVLISGWYLWDRAVDRYGSTVAFTVRQEEGVGASDLLNGFAAQVGGSSTDTDILYKYIQSQGLVSRINEKFDLRALYSQHWDQDPVFSLRSDASLEDMVDYWQRIVRVSYDETARLLELRVLAFTPETAQGIAEEILVTSQEIINSINQQARQDTLRYAQADLEAAQERLRMARTELTLFRTRTQLVDPETDLAGRLGVVNTLQQQLAEAYIAFDLLALSTSTEDPRILQAERRIDVIRERLEEERRNVTNGGDTTTGEDYPTLLAEYESLLADLQFAEEGYRAALTALDAARADAARQSRYLATFIAPTLPETSEFPQRLTLVGLVLLFLSLAWSILALVYYSVRDSR